MASYIVRFQPSKEPFAPQVEQIGSQDETSVPSHMWRQKWEGHGAASFRECFTRMVPRLLSAGCTTVGPPRGRRHGWRAGQRAGALAATLHAQPTKYPAILKSGAETAT